MNRAMRTAERLCGMGHRDEAASGTDGGTWGRRQTERALARSRPGRASGRSETRRARGRAIPGDVSGSRLPPGSWLPHDRSQLPGDRVPEGEREGTRPARCPARTSPGARWGAACELLLRGVAAATSPPRSGETEPLPIPAGASGSGRTLTDSLRGPSPAGCGCGSRPSARHRRRGGAPSRRGRSAGRGERSRAPPRRQRAPRTRRRR